MASSAEGVRDLLPGRRLADRYVVRRLVARGGMAHVYEAHDERLDRMVALKVLVSPFADDPAYVQRFLNEARIAASISHPNLAHIYDSGEDNGARFIVLELLEGYRSLRDELAERGTLQPLDVVRIGREVLAGLAPIHAHGLVHCDVKPANILIGRDGIKLIDFGIARPLHEPSAGATSIGSLQSMSPEQLRGEGLTPASDIFAVGVVLYQALSGKVPFGGDTPAAIVSAQAAGSPSAPGEPGSGVPPGLDAVVLQALELDPARRFASADAMAAALDAATSSMANQDVGPSREDETTTFVPVGGTTSPRAASRARRRSPSPAVLLGVVVLLGVPVVIMAIMLSGFGGPRSPADASTHSSTPRPTHAVQEGKVRVPNTIGMSEGAAEAAARAAGLTWRLEWQVDSSKPPGVYDQEPAAGTEVDEGAQFVMYAYRTQ